MSIAAGGVIAALKAAGVAKEVLDQVDAISDSSSETEGAASVDDVMDKLKIANAVNIQYSANMLMLAKTKAATDSIANGSDVDTEKLFDVFDRMNKLFDK